MDSSRFSLFSGDEVAAAAQAGEEAAWVELLGRYYAPHLRFLTAQTGNAVDAADLTQQTFLVAWQRLSRWDQRNPFVP